MNPRAEQRGELGQRDASAAPGPGWVGYLEATYAALIATALGCGALILVLSGVALVLGEPAGTTLAAIAGGPIKRVAISIAAVAVLVGLVACYGRGKHALSLKKD